MKYLVDGKVTLEKHDNFLEENLRNPCYRHCISCIITPQFDLTTRTICCYFHLLTLLRGFLSPPWFSHQMLNSHTPTPHQKHRDDADSHRNRSVTLGWHHQKKQKYLLLPSAPTIWSSITWPPGGFYLCGSTLVFSVWNLRSGRWLYSSAGWECSRL